MDGWWWSTGDPGNVKLTHAADLDLLAGRLADVAAGGRS